MRLSRLVLVRIVAPAVWAPILTAAIGLLSVRADARTEGIVIDFTNTPTGLAPPGSPWLQDLGIAILVAASILFVWPRSGAERRLPALAPIAMFVVLLGLTVYFMITAGADAPPLTGKIPRGPSAFYGRAATDPAALTWLRVGALSPAIHALLAMCAVMPSLHGRVLRTRRIALYASTEAEDSADDTPAEHRLD